MIRLNLLTYTGMTTESISISHCIELIDLMSYAAPTKSKEEKFTSRDEQTGMISRKMLIVTFLCIRVLQRNRTNKR